MDLNGIDSKYLDGQVWANSVDTDQTANIIFKIMQFSPETEPQNRNFLKIHTPLCKNP